MTRPLLFALSLAVLAAGCDAGPDATDDLSQDPALLVGSWSLTRTQGGQQGPTGPVDYDGPAQVLFFEPDGALTEVVGGETTFDGRYEVEQASVYAVGGGSRSWRGNFGVGPDDLILDMRAVDGAALFYRRGITPRRTR